MIKLWLNYDKIFVMIKLWGNYGVGKGRNTTGFNGCLYYDAFFEVLTKSLKGEKSLPKCSKYKDREL